MADISVYGFISPIDATARGAKPSQGWYAKRVIEGQEILHQGLDFPTAIGTPVRAAADGLVIVSQDTGKITGKWIAVQHENGFTSRYLHLNKRLVKRGQRVRRGQIIAYSGETDSKGKPHLHFDLQLVPARLPEVKPIVGQRVGRAQRLGGKLLGYNVPGEVFLPLSQAAVSYAAEVYAEPSIPADDQEIHDGGPPAAAVVSISLGVGALVGLAAVLLAPTR